MKVKKGCVPGGIAIALLVVLVIAVMLAILMKEERTPVVQRDPVTLEELDELAARLAESEKKFNDQFEGLRSRQRAWNQTGDSEEASPDTPNPMDALPKRLSNVVTEAQLRNHYISGQKDDAIQATMGLTYVKIQHGVKRIFGNDNPEESYELPMMAWRYKQLGDWDASRYYHWRILDTCLESVPFLCRSSLGDLAWLEPDPEIAARMLEVSCMGKSVHEHFLATNLHNAYMVCEATGSEELANHYLIRLYQECPEQAAFYLEIELIPDAPPAPSEGDVMDEAVNEGL